MAEEFLKIKDKVKWFIVRYFGESKFNELISLAENDDNRLFHELDDIWFRLPDHIFNIQNNPPGWHEFLSILDEVVLLNNSTLLVKSH